MMDFFKLLSRSTKLSQSTRIAQPQQTLPSSGQNANPQLFGHEQQSGNIPDSTKEDTVLGKRKRKGRGAVSFEALPAELDFFAAEKPAKSQTRSSGKPNGTLRHGERPLKIVEHNDSNEEEEQADEEALDEEACKTLLRRHKIKITVLSEPTVGEIDVSNKKKKRRSKIGDNEAPGKSKRQIFPRPLQSFVHLRTRYGLDKRLAENIAGQGYKLPTEVQLAALPLLMNESAPKESSPKKDDHGSAVDLLAVAPTGSGKTLAFLIPVLNVLLSEKRADDKPEPKAIIVAPTRELASQIVNEGRKMVENTGLRISLVRKGMKIDTGADSAPLATKKYESDGESDEEQEESTAQVDQSTYIVKSHILVSTPLSLLHAIQEADGNVTPLLKVQFLVLDEADVLLDPLFREQTLAIWKACTKPGLRMSLWSATMGSSIETLALEYMAKNHTDAQNSMIVRLVVGLKDTALPNITHTLTYAASETGKLLALRQLLHPTAPETDPTGRKSLRPPFLVFTQTIERAKALHAELRYDIPPEAGGSSRIAALHSDMTETARGRVMTAFRKGEIWVIITTDLLARGIDFRGLNGVVNYDVPTSSAAYIHRVGRTGRAGRDGGVAVTFYTKEDVPHVKPIANVIAASEKLRDSTGAKEESSVQQWLLDALPTPSKRDKEVLKKKGVESRRSGNKMARISTKSGLRKGLSGGNRKFQDRKQGGRLRSVGDAEQSEFEGFSD
jgi:ATP-dependent RNA helicase DDX52/ROK1